MKPVSLLAEAEKEATEAAAFYESCATGLGRAFTNEVAKAFRSIASRPRAAPVVRGHVRRKLVARFPYAVLFRDDPDEIVVLAVMHGHRRPGYWKDRL